MKLAVLFATLALLFALPAHADTIYDVNATATITGNNVCGGPCVETLSFSLMLDQPTPFTTAVLPGGTFSSSGPIPFGSGSIAAGELNAAGGFIAFLFNPPGGFGIDELDLTLGCEGTPFPCTPVQVAANSWPFGATLFSCGDQTCVNDFCPPGFCAITGGIDVGPIVGTIRVVHTPEPGEAGLLILGIGLLALIGRRARGGRRETRAKAPTFCSTLAQT